MCKTPQLRHGVGIKLEPREDDQTTVIIVVAVLVGALTVPLCGGRFQKLADARLNRAWCLLAALAGQVLITSVMPDMPSLLARSMHLGTYALAGLFLWSNRSILGLWVVALGTLLNVVAIALNSGVMPASASASRVAGLQDAGRGFRNSEHVAHARLSFLGDIFAIPKGWPFANVFSIGDVLIVVGVVLTLHALCESRVSERFLLRHPSRRDGSDTRDKYRVTTSGE
jgi:Family of unknown function (DUF5317)